MGIRPAHPDHPAVAGAAPHDGRGRQHPSAPSLGESHLLVHCSAGARRSPGSSCAAAAVCAACGPDIFPRPTADMLRRLVCGRGGTASGTPGYLGPPLGAEPRSSVRLRAAAPYRLWRRIAPSHSCRPGGLRVKPVRHDNVPAAGARDLAETRHPTPTRGRPPGRDFLRPWRITTCLASLPRSGPGMLPVRPAPSPASSVRSCP